jgi:hypothetical protein
MAEKLAAVSCEGDEKMSPLSTCGKFLDWFNTGYLLKGTV